MARDADNLVVVQGGAGGPGMAAPAELLPIPHYNLAIGGSTPTAKPGIAAGDFNGDGYSDLALGHPLVDVREPADRPHIQAGVVEVLYGSAAGGIAETPDQFGTTLASADFDADGRDELAIGVPIEGNGFPTTRRPQAGEVNVLAGSASGLTGAGSQQFSQSSAGGANGEHERFGISMQANDLDGDGAADLVVGAPGELTAPATGCIPYHHGALNVLFGAPLSGLGGGGALQLDRSVLAGSPCTFQLGLALAGRAGAAASRRHRDRRP